MSEQHNRLCGLPDKDILYVLQRVDIELAFDLLETPEAERPEIDDDFVADVKHTIDKQDGYMEWFAEAVQAAAS